MFRFLRPRRPAFDKTFYLTTYPDVAAAGVDPLEHYLQHGAEGRLPNGLELLPAVISCREWLRARRCRRESVSRYVDTRPASAGAHASA